MIFGFGIQDDHLTQDEPVLERVGCDRIVLVESPQLAQLKVAELIQYLRSGDVLVVVDLDRLGRNMEAILLTINQLKKAGVALRVEKRDIIPGTPLGDCFLKACDCLIDVLPVDRSEKAGTLPVGNANARRRGRPAALSIADRLKAQKLLVDQNASVRWVAKSLNVSPATIYRHFPAEARSRFRRIRRPSVMNTAGPDIHS